ncbi:MAG: hypothetical protein IJF12_02430 [Alphaproteobacteria bacterium]|nr:hypothetical protein [Alphaproteobacteria bacterium]
MYELSGNIKELRIDYQTGKAFMILSLDQKQSAINCFDELHLEEKLSFKIDKHREKRSLNANNYAWKLLTEIGNFMRLSKEDVYFIMLKRYGQSEMISVLSHIPIGNYVKYCEKAGESTLNGKEFTHYKVYKGSSEFDKKEMSIFIDGIVEEAKDLGIPTETPEQIANLKSLWGE